jgi:hypothetical protein
VTLAAGSRTVKVNLDAGVKAGGARLSVRLADAAGNSGTYRRSLHVPRRRA